MSRTILSLCLLALTGASWAATPTQLPVKVDVKAVRVYSGENPAHFIKVEDVGYHEGCPGTEGTGIYFLPPGSKEAYAMLLTAKSSGQKVLLSVKGYDECTGGTNAGYAVIHEVQLGDW